VDEAKIEGDVVTATYTPEAGEFFFQGHFKDEPVLPATIAFEAVGQAACLWVLEVGMKREQMQVANHQKLYFTSMGEAHFHRKVTPGETLTLEARLVRLRSPLAVFDCKITLGDERVAEVFGLTLAFGDTEAAAAAAETSGS
jgi:3-hydroxyacyl-[acyl-carrier-protein] dehydratase